MVNYREILKLLDLGYTQRDIARSIHCSRNTVRDVQYLSKELGIRWPLDDNVTNKDIAKLFHPDLYGAVIPHKEPDYAYMHAELARKGVNLTLLWSACCAECYAKGDNPYMYTQFCEKYRQWSKLSKATMQIKHKPGDVMQVDWAGATIPIYDQADGESSAPPSPFVSINALICFLHSLGWEFLMI